ncbi:MAG: hypothetical protein H7A50_06900 [Akkermansiaceae bacterium]|nr:hypothetical protein [Akkermansiaceae bacterium]
MRDFALTMDTGFSEIDIPAGSEFRPTASAAATVGGWWNYEDVIGAHAIAMDMPRCRTRATSPDGDILRTGVAGVFFAVLVMVFPETRVDLHPMNYFFLAAGCFAFQLLFAYLVDLLPLLPSFGISAAVSLLLVTGYLWRLAGAGFARIAAAAQFSYMVLFSYSFFFDGLTGLTITVGAVVTLALLMFFTAGVDWSSALRRRRNAVPPPVPTAA